MPRDIDPDCGDLDDVYLFDIDDLQQVSAANFEERRNAAEEAEDLVHRGVDQFKNWQKTWSVKPVLAAFRTYLDELIEREASKTLAKEHFRDLSAKQRESLTTLFEAIAGKITADAARQITSPPAGIEAEQLAQSILALFPDAAEHRKDSE
jgi:glutamyl-tRNA reductase